MSFNNHTRSGIFDFFWSLLKMSQRTQLLPVNFAAPWTNLIWRQKALLIGTCLLQVVLQAFYTSVVFMIGWIIEHQSYTYFWIVVAVWIGTIFAEMVVSYFTTILETQCINSIQFGAFKTFLTIDPIYFTHRSRGKIYAKIARGARSYEDVLDYIIFEMGPIFVSMITVIVSFFYIDPWLGLLVSIGLFAVGGINIWLGALYASIFQVVNIRADDVVKAMTVEAITQLPFIRSYFASNEIVAEAREKSEYRMHAEGTSWLVSSMVLNFTRGLYIITVVALTGYVLNQVDANAMTAAFAVSIVLTYIRGTFQVLSIGRRLVKFMRALIQIDDLYSYIRSFGKQTYPVLSTAPAPVSTLRARAAPDIRLAAEGLYFDYNPKARIFKDHHLLLEVPRTQKNKLYGIIGPSGIGKTTLLSLLGGQLKPTRGTVTVNGIDIYLIDDTARKHLLTVQGQTASSLSGTLRRNLLLGLADDAQCPYNDADLIGILKEVGIWSLFEEKDGLKTFIGEGGTSLSGGQRQRLNFASLYLRARYYRPMVILIDEPTSSLDEVSEQAITYRISLLAQHAITIVIAHRLKTLRHAVGILDFSLLDQTKELRFLPVEQLQEQSMYLKRLLQGHVKFEA